MKQFFIEYKQILFFFVLLTGVTGYTLFESDLHQVQAASPQLKSLYGQNVAHAAELTPSHFPTRQPSSVGSENTTGIKKLESVLDKKFLCAEKTAHKAEQVREQMVMIRFDLCQKNLKGMAKELHFENQSNGFKAQIFVVENGSYKTDFIQLNQGINKLKLEVVLKDGQKLEESLEILSGS
ncbi:hypothetical protein [Pseudobdellovibrio exovorus]|uniref:Uncharacterized protein n=1 Tax=Pseudobdellovibrio exovorus JSS TaxID=1184267 RepID=M4V8H1_9BACT|nr:hypothetical protein [Pseudobdellovibrio exovorus]AGH94760.1 hypothetical protein A11Q_540 [Pseudobdellovibrio exovorus JSS]